VKEAVRVYIIARARDMFQARGYRNTSMAELSRACDISKPTLYNYFPSKRDLFQEVLKSLHRETDGQIIPAVESAEGFIAKLKVLIFRSLEFTLRHKDLIRVLMFDAYMLFINENIKEGRITPCFQDMEGLPVRQHLDQQVKVVKKLLCTGKEEGLLETNLDIDVAAHAILGILREFLLINIFFQNKEPDIGELETKIMEFVTRGILKEES
jgi:TetR/AcrR family fatty acid metabolism transcriptional regulator